MKDRILLVLAGIAFAALAWAFWHYTGAWGVVILLVVTVLGVVAGNARRRRESRDREGAGSK